MKRVLSVLLALILVLSFTFSSFAVTDSVEVVDSERVQQIIVYTPVCLHNWSTVTTYGTQSRVVDINPSPLFYWACHEERSVTIQTTSCSNCTESSVSKTYGSWSHSNFLH